MGIYLYYAVRRGRSREKELVKVAGDLRENRDDLGQQKRACQSIHPASPAMVFQGRLCGCFDCSRCFYLLGSFEQLLGLLDLALDTVSQ
jgi:hypothetical protein